MIIQRDKSGVTKYFQGDGITIHDNRRWFSKPNIKEATWKVSQCVANIDKQILRHVLEFAFHLMSPTRHAGGIIVWQLEPQISKPSALSPLKLSINNESHARMLCHLLSQVDGATFLDSSGNLMETAIHLKYSEKSRELVPEIRGTRHTSSVRYSYDNEDTIVVTVSEDGPVTVFSNGANIADLQIYSAYKKARILSHKHSNNKAQIRSQSFEVRCGTCDKNAMIEQVNLENYDEDKQIFCSTCKNILYSAHCSSLEGRSYKVLSNNSF